MRKRGVRVAFCAIFLIAVFATGSSDNSFTEENNLEDVQHCSRWELSLNFSNTIITSIGTNFVSSPLIACLYLEGNQIETIQQDAFVGVPALEYLNMAGNKLSSLMSFGGHGNLRTLILANQSNSYYNRNLDIIDKYPKLRYLDLSGNLISSITWTIQEYNYKHNYPIYTFRSQINTFPELKYLDLSNNAIEEFSNSDQFSPINQNLTHLYLHKNNIYNIDLTTFNNLIVLTLHDNRIQNLRNYCYSGTLCISNLPRLKHFSIYNNRLSSIDRDFFRMPELVSLNFSNNLLQDSLRGKFDKLSSLEDLSIDNNQLTSMTIISNPLNLSSLSLNRNQIKFIDSEDLKNTPFLRKLYLNHNKIDDIHKDAFSALESLEELHLADNLLTDLPAKWCNNLRSLRYLDLTNNKFKSLESLSLSETLPIIDIDFINNSLFNLKAKVLHDLPENVTIHLIPPSNELDPDGCQDCLEV